LLIHRLVFLCGNSWRLTGWGRDWGSVVCVTERGSAVVGDLDEEAVGAGALALARGPAEGPTGRDGRARRHGAGGHGATRGGAVRSEERRVGREGGLGGGGGGEGQEGLMMRGVVV